MLDSEHNCLLTVSISASGLQLIEGDSITKVGEERKETNGRTYLSDALVRR